MKKEKNDNNNKWYRDGIDFDCTGCATCCSDHGEYAYVYLTDRDFLAISDLLGISTSTFYDEYCVYEGGLTHLKMKGPDCPFLKDKKCTVYEARPHQCRTWPFWPANLEQETWEKEVKPFCPGIGKGKHYTAEEITRIAGSCEEDYMEMLSQMDESDLQKATNSDEEKETDSTEGSGRK